MENQPSHSNEKNDRPRDGEGGVKFSQAVPVDDRTPITTFGTGIHHFVDC